MARYVLVSFDDNEKADTFVTACQDTGILGVVSNEDASMRHFAPEVRAVYQMPTKFCDCTDGKNRKFTRGKKYGWWVHSLCGKPTRAWARGEHWFQALGRNLLAKTPQAPEYRGDGDFTLAKEGS